MDSEHISLDGQESYDDLFRKELPPDGFAGLKRLKSLRIRRCETEECLANAPATIVFPVLEELDFFKVYNLREICRGPVPQGSFGKLTSIEIGDCSSLEYLFPLQIVGCLTQLKRLTIQSCTNMKEVIWKEQGDTLIATNGIEFRNLEFLHLGYLTNLVGFCTGIDQIDFPKLRCMHLESFDSPNASSIFPQKVTFPCLEDLSLESLDYSELQISPFLTVKKLVVSYCYNLRYVFNSSEARRLVHLKELNISDCSEMDAVVDWEEEIEDGQERKVDTTLFPQLSKLQLDDLSNLTRLCRGPVPGGSFGELTSVEIRGCDNLRYAFNSSMARHLVHLKELNISDCSRMLAVVNWAKKIEDGQEGKVDTTLFPQLCKLQLNGLRNLMRLCRGPVPGGSFGELTSVEIRGCDNLIYAFNSSMARHLVHLKELNISDCSEMDAVVDWAAEIEDGQERKVDTTLFPQISKLQLNGLRNLTRLCRGPVPGGFFEKLTSVEIRGCDNLIYAFNSSIARHLVHLKELNISDCSEMFAVVNWAKKIEDGQEGKVDTTLFPQLCKLQLNGLRNLMRLCRGPVPGGSFGELTSVEIRGCDNLIYAFNSSMARHLVHLKELNISDCSEMDAVVDWAAEIEDGQERKVDTTLFPQISKLQLNGLRNLTRLCRGPVPGGFFAKLTSVEIRGCDNLIYAFNSSIARHLVHLKELNISDCSEMDAVVDWAAEIEDGQEGKVDTSLFPQLCKLQLNGLRNLMRLCRGPVPGGSFGELTSVEIRGCDNLRDAFNSSMARHLVHLKELNISDCSRMFVVVDWAEEIEDGQEGKVDTTLFPQLSKLQLNGLRNLMWLCRGPVPGGFFGELTSVEIRGCDNLRYAFNSSIARHLVHLKELNISDCSRMFAVVDCAEEIEDGQEGKVDTTLFPQLCKLQLNDLPDLRRFCHFTHTLELPMLSKLVIWQCPSMEEFSLGHVSTPNLSLSDISWNGVPNPNIPWNGDLNNALRLLQEKREKAERERFVVAEEYLKKQRRAADDDIHDEDDLKKRRRVADQGEPHLIQASKIYELAPNIEHENARDVDRHEYLEDSYEMEVDSYESDSSIEKNNNMIPWRETLPPNPQRGRCICFRTADLYTGESVITRFYSVPFDFFGDGGDDGDSSNPDVERLRRFYKCTDFATTSRLSSVGSSLFVVGGSEETGPCKVSITTEKMYRFDTTAPENGWNSYELSMCTPRAFPITVTMDGKLYIFGGSGPDPPLAELFDPCSESSTCVPLPPPSGFHIDGWRHLVVAALQPSKKILVASGLSLDAYVYNVVDQGWEKLDHEVDFSSVRDQAAVVQNGNALCWCSNNVEEVHAYHLVHKRWFKSPIKGLDKVGMRDPDGMTHYCPIFPLDDNHLCLLWKDHMGYDGTNLPLLHCIKIQVSIDPGGSRFDAVVVASRTYALGPHESIFDAHVFLREDDEGGERGSGQGGHENGGRTWERSGYGGGKRRVSLIVPFKTCSKCWGTGHTESSCDQVGSGAGTYG